jgi:subtilisin family serine protease
MNKLLILILIALGVNNQAYSQSQKYWVRFTDKKGVTFNPSSYFDIKAIHRRIKNNIPLAEYSDLPIREDYYLKINQLSDSITGSTRWFNAVACWLSAEAIAEVKTLPFVKEVVKMKSAQQLAVLEELNATSLSRGKQELLEAQISNMEGELFDSLYTGKGIRICIIDAGFPDVDESDLFSHLRENNRIIKTWDFKKNKPNVYRYNSHGTSVLSCIAGVFEGQKIGLATDAEFLLARTERIAYEGIAEEEDWLEAVEWADKNGADIINSSLGYTNASHFVEDMTGHSTIITRAANLAARKGILVVNAAGNEGASEWKYVAAPGDADSALTVGGVNPWTGLHTSFSSYGPNANFKLKPNVSAFGHALGYDDFSSLGELAGTSFASPLVAGFAACVWESDTTLTNMQLFKEIEKSASLYPYYDYATGYGVPKASYFIDSIKNKKIEQTFIIDTTDDVQIKIRIKEEYFIENKWVHPIKPSKLYQFFHLLDNFNIEASNIPKTEPEVLYFHVENELGYLDEYKVIAINDIEVFQLFYDQYKGKTLRFSYKGYIQELKL